MKYFFLLIIPSLFTTITLKCQVEEYTSSKFDRIGMINRDGGALPQMALEASALSNKESPSGNPDTLYVIRFMDMSPKSPIFSKTDPRYYNLYFKSTDGSLAKLYAILLNVFTEEKYRDQNFETVLKLGNKILTIKRDFYSSKPKIHGLTDDGMFIIRNEKELNKLFGRPEE